MDVVRACHTAVVVSAPGMGDDVQAVKAGILEIADVHVVNKADRPDANRTIAELKNMLQISGSASEEGWDVPVLPTVAERGEGVGELADALDRHYEHLVSSGDIERREKVMAADRVRAIIQNVVLERVEDPSLGADFDAAIEGVWRRKRAPFPAALDLLEGSARRQKTEGAAS